MTLTVRPLPTPHDPPAGPVTVATPSCCCCCCCCLATLGTAVGFTAGAVYETAVRRRRPAAVPTVLATLALPLAVVVLLVLFNTFDDLQGVAGAEDELAAVAWVAAIVVYLGLAGGALRLAGAGWGQSVGVPAAVLVCIPVMFVVELPAALFTAFLIELASPVAVLAGIWFGRRTHRDSRPGPWPTAVWIPPGAASPPVLPPVPPPPPPPADRSDDPAPGLPALPRDAAGPGTAAASGSPGDAAPSPEDSR